MKFREYAKLVVKFGGWIEKCGGDEYVVRFPSPHIKAQFEKVVASA